MKKQGRHVFLDLKLFDISNTIENAVSGLCEAEFDFLTVQGDPQVVRAAVKGRGAYSMKILAVTFLTSLDRDDLDQNMIKPGTIGATLVSGINDSTITGPSTLTGNITAASDENDGTGDAALVNFTGAVIISGDITVDTDRVAADGAGTTADANDGAITFGSTILAEGTDTDSLTVKSGSGTLTFSGIIGGTTGKSLTGFDVNHLAGSAAISLPRIGAANRSFAGTSGVTRIGNAATTSSTLSGDDYTFGGGATTLTTA